MISRRCALRRGENVRMRLLFLVLLALVLPAAVHAAAPVAMVTDVQGSVPGASLGRSLEEGTTLVLGEGSRLRLIFMRGASQGRREVVKGPATVKVGVSGSSVSPAGALVVEKAAAPRALVPTRGLQRIGGSVERDALRLALLPTIGPVRFAWKPSTPGESTVRVLDGARVVWEKQTPRRVLDYAGPALVPDRAYTWTVVHEGVTAKPRPFRVVSEAAREKLAEARKQATALAGPDDPTPHLLMMSLYLDQDMLAEAASEARAALEIRPDPALREDLVKLLQATRAWDAPPLEP